MKLLKTEINLKYTGNIFSTGHTESGIYTYYVTQTIEGIESCSEKVTLTITPENTLTTMEKEKNTKNIRSVLFKIFPNPSKGRLFIDIQDTEKNNYQIKIHDLAGEELMIDKYYTPGKNETIELNISSLPKGLYIIHVLCNNLHHTEKVILQ